MLNYSLVVAVICICAWKTLATTPILCNELNTEYNECKTNCTEQCPTKPPQYCTFNCDKGCYCKDGYNRAPNGTCVLTANCPVQCPINEMLQLRCIDTCNERQVACKPGRYGCFCNPGFKRIKGKCVPEANCFICAEPNTEYNAACNNCTEQCLKDPQQYCPFFCVAGCYCKQGYNRAPDGTCILTAKCPIQCPLNEALQHMCADTCDANQLACKPGRYGCFCKPGFQRIDGKCVHEANCFNCGKNDPNEVFNECSSPCTEYCPKTESEICAAVCKKGCACIDNYRRDPKTNKCIPIKKCNAIGINR